MDLKNKKEVSKVIEKIIEEIQRFKNHDYSAIEVRNIINRCYILNDPNIDNNLKKNIRLFTSDKFLAFLNLKIDISKWNNSEDEIKILKEEIKITHEYKRIFDIIEVILSSESKFDELINNLSELSDFYKKKLSKL